MAAVNHAVPCKGEMPGCDIAAVVGLAYEAAVGGSTWLEFDASLCRLLGAQYASLRVAKGTSGNLLRPTGPAEAIYLAHYRQVDPYRISAGTDLANNRPISGARLGEEIIPITELHRNEYYADFARLNGRHHMLGGLISLREGTTIGLHRDAAAGAFTERERGTLETLLPHLQRALQLRAKFAFDADVIDVRAAALDALPVCVFVIDSAMRVLHANVAGIGLTADGKSGLSIIRSGRQSGTGSSHLVAGHRDDNDALKRLVAGVAAGGVGGALRVHAQAHDVAEMASLAVLVSPIPQRLVASGSSLSKPGLAPGAALVVACELAKPASLPTGILCELYGLTKAEAAVAVALVGAVPAEEVARTRRVSLVTIRAQIRTVLGKTNALNLRDLERMIAVVSATLPVPQVAPAVMSHAAGMRSPAP